MSYHVTILRTTRNGKSLPITREEIIEVVSAAQELIIHRDDGRSIEFTTSDQDENGPLLIFENGEIWAKNPNGKTLQLMINIAKPLNARVRGDEFETYETPEATYIHPDDRKTLENVQRTTYDIMRRTRRRQWISYGVIMITFIFLGLVMAYFSRP